MIHKTVSYWKCDCALCFFSLTRQYQYHWREESHRVPELRGHGVWTTGFEFIRGHKEKTRWQLEEEGWARSASCQLHRTVSDQRNWTARRKQVACIFICTHRAVPLKGATKLAATEKRQSNSVCTPSKRCVKLYICKYELPDCFFKLTHHLLK